MRTITFLTLCCATSPLLSCTESTAPTAPTSSIRPAATKTPTITITDLGAFWPAGIGPRGQVVGWTEATPNRAVLWENGVLHDLGTLPGGDHARALGINAAGQIVGMGNSSTTGGADMVHHAVMWKDGAITDLGELGILTNTDAGAVSPSGVVVGNAGGGPMVHAFRWEKGVMTELSALPPASWDQRRGAAAINSQGQIVGYSEVLPVDEGNYHAVRWDKDGVTDLGTLPGGTESLAASINEAGQIVGQALTADGQFVAVLWDHGRVTNLGTPSGGFGSAANAINNQGQIVGFSSIQGVVHAVLWTVK